MKSQIHLIRHGITKGNQNRLYYGAADIPLAKEGKEELKRLAAADIYPDGENSDFYTSGLLRAEQTLFLIYGDIPHSYIRELKEMSFGKFEMKSYEDLKDIPEYIKWCSDTTGDAATPEGESVNGFHRRIQEGFEILLGKHRLKELSVRHCGKDAVSTMVCHGGTIGSILQHQFPEEREHFYKWIPDPGHGYTLNIEDGAITGYEEF